MANWFGKITDGKDNAKLLGVLFELLLEEYSDQKVTYADYIEYRDLICYYRDCISLNEEKQRLADLYHLSL